MNRTTIVQSSVTPPDTGNSSIPSMTMNSNPSSINNNDRANANVASKEVINPFLDLIKDQSLEDQANCYSRWTMSYLGPLMNLGSKKILEAQDCGVPSKIDRADHAFNAVHNAWMQEVSKAEAKPVAMANSALASNWPSRKERPKDEETPKIKLKEPSLSMALLRSFGVGKFAYAMFLYVVSALLQFIPVLLLKDLVTYFQTGQQGLLNPWVEVVALGVIPFVVSILQTQHFVIMTHMAVFSRSGCCTLLYNKSLAVSSTGRARTSTGQVMNMMSNDTAQLQRFLQFVGNFLVAPLQIIIALVLIYDQVQNATW